MNLTGLAASTWDEFAGQDPKWDYHIFRGLIDRHPGRVLDVGCGTGRLLIPYLALGIDIEGVDSSEEALAICRQKAAAEGLSPVLHRQHMQTLKLESRYRTIILPGGTFHLVVDRDETQDVLRRFHDHLEPGGILALALEEPEEELNHNAVGQWVPRGVVKRRDGLLLHQDRMVESVDEINKVTTTHVRFRVVRDGEVVEEEVHLMKMRLFSRDELGRLLEQGGFWNVEGIAALGSYSEEIRSGWEPIVTAKRPGGRPLWPEQQPPGFWDERADARAEP